MLRWLAQAAGRKREFEMAGVRRLLKAVVSGIFYHCGLFSLCRMVHNRSGRRLTILAYHRVTDGALEGMRTSLPTMFVTRETFSKQLMFLKRYYNIITFEELRSFNEAASIPPNSLIVTFDDGYMDNFRTAYPVMKAHHVPSVMYLAMKRLDGEGSNPYWWDRMYYYLENREQWYRKGEHPDHDREVGPLLDMYDREPGKLFRLFDMKDTRDTETLLNSLQTAFNIPPGSVRESNETFGWDDVRRMRADVEFGSHSMSHYNLTHLESEALEREVGGSREVLAGRKICKVATFAYPGGAYDERVRKAVADAGYEYAVTTQAGINDLSDKLALKRISVWEGTSRGLSGTFSASLFAFKVLGM